MTSQSVAVDHRKLLKPLYAATGTPALVEVPPLQFLMVDGRGDPNTAPEYASAVQALYSMAYTIRFAAKRTGLADFTVMPLEGLWWSPDMSAFTAQDKASWHWRMMIMQPDAVSGELVEQARAGAAAKADPDVLARVRLEPFDEGRCAQVLHVGPYSAEEPTIRRLHEFIAGQGLALRDRHHEIYLGDPRRAAPERLRTVIRQPVGP